MIPQTQSRQFIPSPVPQRPQPQNNFPPEPQNILESQVFPIQNNAQTNQQLQQSFAIEQSNKSQNMGYIEDHLEEKYKVDPLLQSLSNLKDSQASFNDSNSYLKDSRREEKKRRKDRERNELAELEEAIREDMDVGIDDNLNRNNRNSKEYDFFIANKLDTVDMYKDRIRMD